MTSFFEKEITLAKRFFPRRLMSKRFLKFFMMRLDHYKQINSPLQAKLSPCKGNLSACKGEKYPCKTKLDPCKKD